LLTLERNCEAGGKDREKYCLHPYCFVGRCLPASNNGEAPLRAATKGNLGQ
jgi:hypothetical protein